MKNSAWVLLLAAGTGLLLAACTDGSNNSGDGGDPGNGGFTGGPGVISGQVRLSNNLASMNGSNQVITGEVEASNIIAGEVIVKFKAGLQAQSPINLTLKAAGQAVQVNQVRSLSLPRMGLYRAKGLDKQGTLNLVQQLEARNDVEYAQANRILRATATPTDGLFGLQWDLQAPTTVAGGMNITGAWDAHGTGTASTVVAVIDTGILYAGDGSSKTHPDLTGRVLPGFDFISDPVRAGDGDGRDPDAFDPGDDQLTFHGSHVAGTIMASANNGGNGFDGGIVGINWAAKLLPVRVLGNGGGSTADIVEGMLWAAGLPVAGVPNNPNPAGVINLSLGGQGACGPAEQEAYTRALNAPQKPVIVVAAGNENQDAAGFSPGSCAGVITVGATDQFGARAPYSNFGPRIDVMAPGGDLSQPFGGQSSGGGMLSLTQSPQGVLGHRYLHGTSMAAPHVAGLASLMKGLKPNLSSAEALDLFKRAGVATGLNAAKCKRPQGSDCGVGLLEAKLALDALQSAGNTPDFTLALSSAALPLAPGGAGKVTVSVKRTNGFGEAVALSIAVPVAGLNTSFVAAGTDSNELSINAAASLAAGTYNLSVRGTTASGLSKSVALSVQVRNTNDAPNLQGALVLTCIRILGKCANNTTVGVQITSNARQANYNLSGVSSSGVYVVLAYKDTNANTKVDNGDYIGAYLTADGSALAQVRPPKTGVNLDLDRVVSITSGASKLPASEANTIQTMIETHLSSR